MPAGIDLVFDTQQIFAEPAGAAGDSKPRRLLMGAGMGNYTGGPNDDVYTGTEEYDEILGEGGNDTLHGAGSDDYVEGGAGDDKLYGDVGDDWLEGNDGQDQLFGGDGDDVLFGFAGNDQLSGGAGNDFFRGGAGVDSVDGGADSAGVPGRGDTLNFADMSATQGAVADLRTGIVANDGFGNAETFTGIEAFGSGTAYADTFYHNNLGNIGGVGGGDTVFGFGGDDRFTVGGAPALLDGGDGADRITVGQSDLMPDSNGDGRAETRRPTHGVVIDLGAGTYVDGFDRSGTVVSIENVLGSSFDDTITGSDAANVLEGNWGDDTLDGAGGDDELRARWGSDDIRGGAGVDTLSYEGDHYEYAGSDLGGVIVDLAAGTVDEKLADHYNLGSEGGPLLEHRYPDPATAKAEDETAYRDTVTGIENVVGTGYGDRIYGDGGDNVIAPGAGNDFVDGRGGSDTIDYRSARGAIELDLVGGTAHQDGTGEISAQFGMGPSWTFYPFEADDYAASTDTLVSIENALGSALADTLKGDIKANMLAGNGGDDRINGRGGSDVIDGGAGNDTLTGGGGTDTATYALAGAGVRVSLAIAAAQKTSGAGTDTLSGFENLAGSAFADKLTGDGLSNRLDGGAGADTLRGGGGNDCYIVDEGGDLVLEIAGEGTDTVLASVSFSLAGQYVEKLILTGSDAIDAAGNGLDNVLYGNEAANRLDGRAGADRMEGGGGDDSYVVENAGDKVVEAAGGGTDTVHSSVSFSLAGIYVERLVLLGGNVIDATGNGLANGLTGNLSANVLRGEGGDDAIFGKGGNDTLSGGDGADKIHFDTALSAADNVDRIGGFSAADDTIMLDRAIFGGISANGTLSSSAFAAGTAAADADDRIVYDSATGRIFYDADGSGAGAALLFAQVSAGTALTNLDFVAYTSL